MDHPPVIFGNDLEVVPRIFTFLSKIIQRKATND